jgi:hypothetical protein
MRDVITTHIYPSTLNLPTHVVTKNTCRESCMDGYLVPGITSAETPALEPL